jgi:glycine dehydrogenase subunit 2
VKTVFDISRAGKCQLTIPSIDETRSTIPDELLRQDNPLPDISEVECVRHYTKLSTMNFGVDTGFYPLGSCTMKYNPKINERLALLSGLAMIHPAQDEEDIQGELQLIYNLENKLSRITGMDSFTLMPAAGAHGELTSVMIIKEYFKSIGEERKNIIIPDSAHGTNPASVAMCGFNVISVPSDDQGNVDLEELKKVVDENTAGMMLTSPSTLGFFDPNIKNIAEILHSKGALFYGDGANFNAVIGKAKMANMGFDLIHLNLHKTFATPHGGGGPGAGPVGVVSKLEPFLPNPRVVKKGDLFSWSQESKKSIGRVHSWYGNFLVLVKAYIYLLIIGNELPRIAEISVLNANYLKAHLREIFNLPIDRVNMHEFILNDVDLPHHVTTNDIAKRILDYGFHAPTVYFPLIIPGAMMIEPTETEDLESLDSFIEAMTSIRKEIDEEPNTVKKAPLSTPVGRVDSVTAARKPILRWDHE